MLHKAELRTLISICQSQYCETQWKPLYTMWKKNHAVIAPI